MIATSDKSSSQQIGVIVDFNEHVGLGHVRSDDDQEYLFHCTQISDGSRTISVGTVVSFELKPTHKGLIEAFRLVPAE